MFRLTPKLAPSSIEPSLRIEKFEAVPPTLSGPALSWAVAEPIVAIVSPSDGLVSIATPVAEIARYVPEVEPERPGRECDVAAVGRGQADRPGPRSSADAEIAFDGPSPSEAEPAESVRSPSKTGAAPVAYEMFVRVSDGSETEITPPSRL